MGDVVEFEYCGKRGQGIVFNPSDRDDGELSVSYSGHRGFNLLSRHRKLKKIGRVDGLDKAVKCHVANDIAKAYFSKEAERESTSEYESETTYQVGDLVEEAWGEGVLNVGDVVRIHSVNTVDLVIEDKDGMQCFRSLKQIRPLSGTYAERQAKWVEFHGIKVGSKVKVVRSYESREHGFAYGTVSGDVDWVGVEAEVKRIRDDNVRLCSSSGGTNFFPYFALEPIK